MPRQQASLFGFRLNFRLSRSLIGCVNIAGKMNKKTPRSALRRLSSLRLSSRFRNPPQPRIMPQKKIASMKCLHLKARAITRDEQPMADLVFQQLNRAKRRKLPAQPSISRVGALRKNKPNAVVARRFGTVPEHANQVDAHVNGETGKHAPHLGIQGHQRFQNKSVRSLLSWFGRASHGLQIPSKRTIPDLT